MTAKNVSVKSFQEREPRKIKFYLVSCTLGRHIFRLKQSQTTSTVEACKAFRKRLNLSMDVQCSNGQRLASVPMFKLIQ